MSATTTFSTFLTTYRVTVFRPKPITDPRRMLPLQRMNWSRDAYGALLAFQQRGDEESDEARYYNESSLDIPF